ncbi:hypothetical protein E2C01_058951 [Portunus trituberculatus]|uniref:Uncharacterized protein n=1 Tax=Portunus trituberculatus TaxID=210409 RepID=A0A5B7GWW6_PORTR|nr:hypothetical protein [Portunus trituberculatus]
MRNTRVLPWAPPPLSAVKASLYMELLENDSLMRVMGDDSLRDDILVIMPTDTKVNVKLRKLNEVNVHIDFTVEEEDPISYQE